MSPELVEALYFALKCITVVFVVNVAVLVFLWRLSVYKRTIARRDIKTNDDWFSETAQKELYRDFSV